MKKEKALSKINSINDYGKAIDQAQQTSEKGKAIRIAKTLKKDGLESAIIAKSTGLEKAIFVKLE